jgi:hypothetical protein
MVQLGLGDGADTHTRMMFETMLATHFVLSEEVHRTRNGHPVPDLGGRALTAHFRTSLYMANDAINGRRFVTGLLQAPGLENSVPAETRALFEQHATEWENEIGPEWTELLRPGRVGYSGLNVQHLAETCGFLQLYAAVYRTTSAGVHATDAGRFIEIDETPEGAVRYSASSNTDHIANALGFASLMMTNMIMLADHRLKLGIEAEVVRLHEQAQQMRLEFPDE